MSANPYTKQYFQKFKNVGFLRRLIFSNLIDTKQPILHKLMSHFSRDGSLLDYGCGPGLFLKHATKHFKAVGIDISADAIKSAKLNAPLAKSKVGSLETILNLEALSFDVITCFDVLEHVGNPGEYLKLFHTKLKNNGWLVIAVPTIGSVAYLAKGNRWSGFEDKTHLRLWSRNHWIDVLENNGFLVWRRYSYGIVNSPTEGFKLNGWLKLLHYVTQPLAIMGLALPSFLSDGDYFVCIKNPYAKS